MGTFSDPQHTHPGIFILESPPPPPPPGGGGQERTHALPLDVCANVWIRYQRGADRIDEVRACGWCSV